MKEGKWWELGGKGIGWRETTLIYFNIQYEILQNN